MIKLIADIESGLSVAPDRDSVRDLCQAKLSEIGFEHFAYMAVSRLAFSTRQRQQQQNRQTSRYFITSYPAAWTDRYLERTYLKIDPAFLPAFTGHMPFVWQNDAYDSLTEDQIQFFKEAEDVGISRGVTVPIHGYGNEFATLHVTSMTDRAEFAKQYANYRHELTLFALCLHAFVKESGIAEYIGEDVHLSPRETESLLWTSRGKTAWEISEILGISEETVISYLKSCSRKFGVYSKHHAVVKAIIRGMIIP